MEQDNPGRSQQLHDDQLSDVDVRGTRNISKLEKLETERTQTTTSRSITTNDHQGGTQYTNGDDSMRRSSSPEIMIDDALQQQRTSAAAGESDDRRSRKTEQGSEVVEQRSGTQVQRYDAEKRRSTARRQSFNTKEQARSARSLSRHERNVAAAEMAYRMVGLPADIEYSQVSKRSKAVSTGGHQKPRGGLSGLEDTADFIVEDAMEQAIEAMYGKKRRRKMTSDMRTSSSGVTRSLDRDARTTATVDRHATSGYDTTLTENRALGRTINESTSRDESRKKAVYYMNVEKDDEDIEDDLNLRRPASADGRLTNRVDYMARRRARAVHRLPNAALSRSRYQAATYTSPHMSQHQRRTATSLLASQRVSGYSSETEMAQSSTRRDRRQRFNGDDSDFSTTIEVKSPLSTQFQDENGRYGSDDSETQNVEYFSSHSRVPTLTKGMVTKVLHGDRPRLQTTEMLVSEVCRPDVQMTSSPVQFTASPPHSIVLSSPTFYRDRQLSAVVPVASVADSRSTFRPSAVDDNFLLRQAPAYQSAQYLARQRAVYGGGETGRSTPTSIHDVWPSSSYAAFSNEPIIVANLDDDFITKTTSMRRARSLLALDEMSPSPVSAGIPRSQTPNYASRPDISMTNRQVLNLYLFDKRSTGDGGKRRAAEYETLTRTMTFGEERAATGNKQTQTMTVPRRDKTQLPKTKHSSKYIQTDSEHIPPKPAQKRKPIPSRVTEETVIMKPSITESRETEMVGDVFAARPQISSEKPEAPAVRTSRSLVTDAHKESLQEEPEEEMLETTVVEEKEQRIEMTIREDLEFSLQRSRGNGQAVTRSAGEGRVEPWWIPDTFEAFVERKRQKITQTKDMENKDDHSKRIDIEYGADNSPETLDASESNNFENSPNYETNVESQSTVRNEREAARNVRIPIFLEGCYNSPMHGMTSPSSSLVRTKMKTHSEPELNRRHQYYLAKRDKYYDSLFDDSRRKPLSNDQSNNENSFLVTSSHTNKRQQTSSADVPELRLEVIDDEEASDNSSLASQEPRSAERRYVSSYSQYISPPPSSGVNMASTTGNDEITTSRSHAGTGASHQPRTPGAHEVFRTSKIINVKPKNGDGEAYGHDDDQIPSLDHFDRVLTEIEEELPPPPLPPPLTIGSQPTRNTSSRAPQASTSQHHSITSSTTPSAATPLTHKKNKPKPPEKSWKHSDPLLPKSGKLYSSHKHHVDATTSGHEKQRSTAPRSETQSTSLKASDKGIIPTSSTAANRQQATGADFRHELGDRSYISLSLTEPVQKDRGSKDDVVTQEQAAPGGFTYGWKTKEQKKRKHAPQPGSYQLRHSRWPAEEYETAATAF